MRRKTATFLDRLKQTGFWVPTGLTGYLWAKGLHPGLPGLSCPFFALTGIPCPGCYLTRATAAALAGNLRESINLHALGPVAAMGLVAWSIAAIKTKKIVPFQIRGRDVALWTTALVGYWLVRASLYYVGNIRGFPTFPEA